MNEIRARITVRVKPRASRDQVEGFREDVLVVRLTSPPVEGAANASLIALLAKKTGIPKTSISIVTGDKARSKVLEFNGIGLDELKGRLE